MAAIYGPDGSYQGEDGYDQNWYGDKQTPAPQDWGPPSPGTESQAAPSWADSSSSSGPLSWLENLTNSGQPQGAAPADNSSTPSADPVRNQAPLNHMNPSAGDPATPGVFTKILQGLGLSKPGTGGSIDYSDPATLDHILKLVNGVGGIAATMMGPANKKSAAELSASLKSPFDNFNPTQQAAADSYFNSGKIGHELKYTPSAPIVPSRRYAEGGGVDEVDDAKPEFHSQGALSLVTGKGGGQDDLVPARLAKGEYVMDADVVSALGDGSNERGAEILDKWREELRSHKRSAPAAKIPPKAKAPAGYMSKVKVK